MITYVLKRAHKRRNCSHYTFYTEGIYQFLLTTVNCIYCIPIEPDYMTFQHNPTQRLRVVIISVIGLFKRLSKPNMSADSFSCFYLPDFFSPLSKLHPVYCWPTFSQRSAKLDLYTSSKLQLFKVLLNLNSCGMKSR